jgi:hypothetical protein
LEEVAAVTRNGRAHHEPLERAVAVISLDAEQIWGHLDLMNERQFSERYPEVERAYEKLLDTLCAAGVRATWLVVGGMALSQSDGARDPRLAGLPSWWVRPIPPGDEITASLWYRRTFVRRLKEAQTAQEIGLHGGLTHLIWTEAPQEAVHWELIQGLKAFEEVSIRPESFSFPRNQEAFHELLQAQGLLCYRGRAPIFSEKLGRSLPGSVARALEELGRHTPPPVWPIEAMPGLWNVPASLFLYPIGEARTRFVALASRLQRVCRGLNAAVRCRGVFHFCLHPANLAESPRGFPMFEAILEQLIRRRELGDIEILSMAQVAHRMQTQPESSEPAAVA